MTEGTGQQRRLYLLGVGLFSAVLLAGCFGPAPQPTTSLPSVSVLTHSDLPPETTVSPSSTLFTSPTPSTPSASVSSSSPSRPSSASAVTTSKPTAISAITLTVPTSGVTGTPAPATAEPPPAEHTLEGAKRFAEWYDRLGEVALTTRSVDLLRKYSATKCEECKRLIDNVTFSIKNGTTYEFKPGWSRALQSTRITDDYASVVILRNSGGYAKFDDKGKVLDKSLPATSLIGVVLYWTGTKWLVTSALVVSE